MQGGISTLKLMVPFSMQTKKWVVLEMGKGSTQITRFEQITAGGSDGSSGSSGVGNFIQQEFAKVRRRSIVRAIDEEWEQHTDPESGKSFYHNETTGVSQWTQPEKDQAGDTAGDTAGDESNGVANFIQSQFKKARRSSIVQEMDAEWTSHFNAESNKTFYHNETTGVSQYENPNEQHQKQDEQQDEQQQEQQEQQQEFAMKRRTSISESVDSEWTIHTDPKSNSIFYHNEKTGLSSWTMPSNKEEVVDQEYDTQEDYGDGEDNEDSEEDPEDAIPADAYESLLTQQRSLMFETRQWRAHAEEMERMCLTLQRRERGLRAEFRNMENVATAWRDRAISSEKALLGFDGGGGGGGSAVEDLQRALAHIDELNAMRRREQVTAQEMVRQRDYFRQQLVQRQQEQQEQQRQRPDYRAKRNWY